MKHIVTLISNINPDDIIKMVVESDTLSIGPKTVQGYDVAKVETIDPLKLHMFFGVALFRALDEGVKEAMDAVEQGDGECSIKEFATEAEKNAYLQGLDDGQGWEGFTSIEGFFLDEDVPDKIREFEENL